MFNMIWRDLKASKGDCVSAKGKFFGVEDDPIPAACIKPVHGLTKLLVMSLAQGGGVIVISTPWSDEGGQVSVVWVKRNAMISVPAI